LEGTEPLFSGYIRPGAQVQMRIDNSDWKDLPALAGKIDDAFTPIGLQRYSTEKGITRQIKYGVTHFRILLR